MTTDALHTVHPLPKTTAAAKPVARRAGRFVRLLSLFVAAAVPVDGGWAPPHLSPAADRCLSK